MAACELTAALDNARELVEQSDAVAVKGKSKAAAKPWYPRGYDEFQDGIAYGWVNGASNDCYFWTIDIIARNGCPDSLYAELSLQDRSVPPMGHTIDAVGSVRPGQRARINFETYDDATQTGYLSEISYY